MKRLLDTEVKYMDQTDLQVPPLLSSWGSLVDYLDCTLVLGTEGFDIVSITTIEDPQDPEKYWLSYLKLKDNHTFKQDLSVVEISNTEDLVYNNQFRVQEISEQEVCIAFSKELNPFKPPDITESVGKIRLAPLGYEKVFEAPQKAVYKVTTKDDKYCYLRLDNSCPEGRDPSKLKFARVSMLSDMDFIDDYAFKLGRYKSPAYENDYDRGENSIYDVWFHSRYNSSEMNMDGVGYNLQEYCIVGDSSTFYLSLDNLRYSSSYYMDKTYIFGLYDKFIYKEDPLPFILHTSERISITSPSFDPYNYYSNLTRDRNYGKHTFKTDFENIFTSATSDRWAPWLGDGYHSGANTRVNFKPYKNEIKINLVDSVLRFYRFQNTVLEGKYRGIKFILNNLQDSEQFLPKVKEPFSQDGRKFIRIKDRDYSEISYFLIQLDNWSDI